MNGDHKSRLANNILLFCRTLRKAGLPIGPGQVAESVAAVAQIGLDRRDDFYYALRAVLITDPSQFRLFDQAFHIYFRNPRLLERMMALLLPTITEDSAAKERGETMRRLIESLATSRDVVDPDATVEIDRSASWSDREVLRHRDFEQMTLAELAEAKRLLAQQRLIVGEIPVRRFRRSAHGAHFDLRRSMQLMLRNNGQIIELAKKRRRVRAPNLVLICDISGSMSRYSRMFLHLAHTLSQRQTNVFSFVFGTRLTNISRRLKDRDVDNALQQIADDVKDWDGGTRIADSLATFNAHWARRVLARDSVVLLLSDGLERDSQTNLEFQMQRLQRCCDRLIWLNPLLRYASFEAKASGVRAMLPHVDLFVPAHNLASLDDIVRALARGSTNETLAA